MDMDKVSCRRPAPAPLWVFEQHPGTYQFTKAGVNFVVAQLLRRTARPKLLAAIVTATPGSGAQHGV